MLCSASVLFQAFRGIHGALACSVLHYSSSTTTAERSFPDLPGLEREQSSLKTLLSGEYGRKKDVVDEITNQLVKKVQRHPADFQSTEVQIAQLTARLRNLQEAEAIARKNNHKRSKRAIILSTFYRRHELLNDLRQYRFEAYCHVMEALDLKHILPPEKYQTSTKLAEDVADMKIRAFAESLRRDAELKQKEQELEELTAKIKRKLRSEATEPHDST